ALWQLGEGEYRALPAVDADGSVLLDVELDPSVRRPRAPAPVTKRLKRFAKRRIKWVLRPVRRAVFRGVFRLARLTDRRHRKRILFTSDSHDTLTGNLRLVHDLMVERGLDRTCELRTFLTSRPRRGRGIVGRFRLPIALARADVVVLDDYHPLVYQLDFGADVKVVQLWHATGAFKTVGYSRIGRPGAPSPYGRAHKNYTHAIVSSRFEVPCYAEAFGIPESRVHPTGIPRMDRFFDPDRRARNRESTFERFPQARGRFTILFAPTFRGHGARGARYNFDLLDYAALHALCVEKDAVVIFRMHPFVRRPLMIPAEYADRLLDGSGPGIEVNDLLPAMDLLVTDYSSVVFEFAALGKPMLFFAYDLEQYVSSRGFYTPYEEFVPGPIIRTFPELLDAIRGDEYEVGKVAAFAARHLDHVDGRSADRVVDMILAG
ncbi:MAG: CDP-glycerol glycerophosphotransferase family protein, partial [Chloroflexota bacterium]